MELKVVDNYNTLSATAANLLIDCVKKKPTAVLCFATGDSPKLTYQLLVEYAAKDKVDFSKCSMIGLDEWLGIPPTDSGTCHYFLHQYLFQPMGIASSQIHLFNALTTSEEGECELMNDHIAAKGGIDFMVVGVGMNGHIGFNEPGTDIDSVAHVAVLDEITRIVGKKYFQGEVPINKGITLGLKQVLQAKTLLMLANGKKKAPVIKQAVQSAISTYFPATLIRQHSNGILLIDQEAAAELEKTTK